MFVSKKSCKNNCSQEEVKEGNCSCSNSIATSIKNIKDKAVMMIASKEDK